MFGVTYDIKEAVKRLRRTFNDVSEAKEKRVDSFKEKKR